MHIYQYTDKGKERVADHPPYPILNDETNEEVTSFVFRETLMSHLLIWGNVYAQIIRDGAGRVLGLYPLLPNKMQVDRADNGEIIYIYSRDSEENPNFITYGQIYLRQQDVLHIPGPGFDGLVRYSPIAMAKDAVGMTQACEEYGASYFANVANPGGVLEHPGVLKDPGKVRESWNAVYRGTNNAHKIAVLEEGMLYRIPPHKVGDLEKSNFSNIEQQSLEFVKYTMKDVANTMQYVFAAMGGSIGAVLGGFDGFLYALIVFVVVDYITGVMVGIFNKELSSQIGFRGIFKKVVIFSLVAMAHIIDTHVNQNGSVLRTTVIFFYLSNEEISILENVTLIGLPIPKKIKDVLEQLKENEVHEDK